MRKVTIVTAELKKIVTENRAKHVSEYLEAEADYKALVLKVTRANLRLANTGDMAKIAQIKPLPPPPQSHEAEYNRAIRMLELSADGKVEIEEDVFNQLVMDEWDWKHHFLTSNTMYKAALR